MEALSEHILHCTQCIASMSQLKPDDALLQTLRGGETPTLLPPAVQAVIARLSAPGGAAADIADTVTPVSVQALVSRYQDLRKQGQKASPEELCASCPELVGDLRQRLEALAQMERMLASSPASRS
jgi:hypothetical protein